jgi:TRAP-type C4-dicarboxylate transport system permease small subunit
LKVISRINAALGYLEMAILATAVLIMFVVICCQVLFRYVLHQPSPWTEELARYLFIWVSMIGAAYGVYTQAHFGFELLVKKMSPRMQHAGHYFILLSMGILVFVLVVYGLRMVNVVSFQVTPALQLPMRYVYYSLPVSGLLMAFHLFHHVLIACRPQQRADMV